MACKTSQWRVLPEKGRVDTPIRLLRYLQVVCDSNPPKYIEDLCKKS